jgi:Bifunctional DNA primase/polymerase, N-terminal
MQTESSVARLRVPESVLGGISPLVHALALVGAGFQCVTLHAPTTDGGCTCKKPDCGNSRGKHPYDAAWQKKPLIEEQQVRDSFARFRTWTPNLGMILGEQRGGDYIIAIDVDDEPRYQELLTKYGQLPETPQCKSGRGFRLIFRLHDDVPRSRLKNLAGLGGAKGVDVKCNNGGQVAIAPSIHYLGIRYAWERVGEIAWLPAEWVLAILSPAEPPKWVRDFTPQTIRGDQRAARRIERWLEKIVAEETSLLSGITEGSRNNALLRTTVNLLSCANGTMLSTSFGYVIRQVINAGLATGLPQREVEQTVENARAYVEREGLVRYPREVVQPGQVNQSGTPPPPSAPSEQTPLAPSNLDSGGFPIIKITTSLADVADATVAALAAGDKAIYQRDGALVRVVRIANLDEAKKKAASEGAPEIGAIAIPTLLERLTRVAKYLKINKDAWVPTLPTKDLTQAVFHRGEWSGVRDLLGILESPSLRPDGRVIDVPGYDDVTKFLYAPSCEFLPVPDAPTQEDAIKGLEELREVFVDFPFAPIKGAGPGKDQPGREVPIAAILTILGRPAIKGACPGFLIDAPTPGSGKSMCNDAACMIATGRAAPRGTFPSNDEELEKMMGACAVAGRLVMGFDNVDKPFGGGPIDKYLAAIDTVDVRILGRTEMPIMRWRGIMLASGNNFHIKGDTFRRVLKAIIETNEENPETRTGFKHAPLLPWVLEERPRLVRAALTMLRAYVLAVASGAYKPVVIEQPMGGFEAWTHLVVQTIIFAGGQNVLGARPAKDSSRGLFLSLLTGWSRLQSQVILSADGKALPLRGRTAREALEYLYPSAGIAGPPAGWDALKEAIETLTSSSAERPPHPLKFANQLRNLKGRKFGGIRLVNVENRDGISEWEVVDSNNVMVVVSSTREPFPSARTENPVKVLQHTKTEPCPRCHEQAFCDNCGICTKCHFSAPDVDLPHPPAPHPKLKCSECGETSAHARTCAVTRKAASN